MHPCFIGARLPRTRPWTTVRQANPACHASQLGAWLACTPAPCHELLHPCTPALSRERVRCVGLNNRARAEAAEHAPGETKKNQQNESGKQADYWKWRQQE